MSSDDPKKEKKDTEIVGGVPVRSSADEFDPTEMLKCGSCGRITPPNRLDCLYCGAALEVNEDDNKRLRPVLRPPDENVRGFSIVSVADGYAWNEAQLKLAASMTRIEVEDLAILTSAGCAVPIARSDSETVAVAAQRLRESGVRIETLSDEVFELEDPQKRLRSITLRDDGTLALILFNNDEVESVSKEDVAVIVTGVVLENRIEANEKHKRKGLDKVLNSMEVSADEVLIDVYTNASSTAFRIQASGFDFSFLGNDKDLLAAKNVEKTISALREFAPDAVFIDRYSGIRSRLNEVWKVEERQDTKSFERRGFGSFEKKRVVTSSNIEQFTKFSRLQWLMRSTPNEVRSEDGI